MKLSRKFLSDYLDIEDISSKEIAEKMTFAGNEYESITSIASGTNLVVGLVHECIDHPDSDHLHVCQVEIKPGEITQIVCGAPNVATGQKVIVALIGAVLPGDFEIKKSKIRGEESNGMICALGELGVDNKYQNDEDKAGIHVLPHDAPIGENALSYLGFDDETIDFELTANRGDLLSIMGMAYEIGAILDKKVKLPTIKIDKETDDITKYLSLDVKTENCPLYLARMVKDVEIHESPAFIKARLIASGIRPINNVVDISNYVMLELGQPLHFFDYKTLGNKIIVRMSKDKEEITTLDSETRTLTDSDIVIANDKEPVALAGVMGGLNSEIELGTKDIVIESAIFNSTLVRLTSKRVLRSEASNRFEKGIDPTRTYMAITYACELLEKYANAKVIKGTVIHDKIDYKDKVIEISQDEIEAVLGLTLTNKQILDIFKRLAFEVEEDNNTFDENIYKVSVPSRRLDISIKEDLIEEIGRINGMDSIVGRLPMESIKPGKYDKVYLKEKLISKRLEALGLNQVMTYSLTSEKDLRKFTNDEFISYEINNPMTEDRKYMRYSLIPSLISVADYNLSRKNNDIFIYEISKVYYMKDNENVMESKVAGILLGGYLNNTWQHIINTADFYTAKGIIESLLDYLGLKGRYTFDTENIPSDYHPYQTARILMDKTPMGYVGAINPTINKNKLFIFELNLEIIFNTKIRNIKNKEVSKYPSITKDLAFILNKDINSSEVIETIKKSTNKLLINVEVFDYYVGENIDSNKKSLAFSLNFSDNTRTLNEEEVMMEFNKAIKGVTDKHSAILRDK